MSIKKNTKADFIELVYNSLLESGQNTNREFIKLIIDTLLLKMKESLIAGHPIEIRGLGVFEFRYRQPKLNAHNPRTGKKVVVAGHTVVAFRSGNELREAVWNADFENNTTSVLTESKTSAVKTDTQLLTKEDSESFRNKQ